MNISENMPRINFIVLNKDNNSWEPLSTEKLISPSRTSDLGIIILTKKTPNTTILESSLIFIPDQNYIILRFRS